MDKEDVVYIYNGILLSHKNEQNNAVCSHMDGPRDHLCLRERQISYDGTYMWNLKEMVKMNLLQKWKWSHTYKANLWLSGVKGGRDKLGGWD